MQRFALLRVEHEAVIAQRLLQPRGPLHLAMPRTHGLVGLAHLLQKLVAHRVAAGIVDELELVEVDGQHGVPAGVFVRLVQRAGAAFATAPSTPKAASPDCTRSQGA